MSLDKAIRHLKERRKPYRGAKAVDKTCRNHGSDDWATSDRLIQPMRELAKAEDKLNEYRKSYWNPVFENDEFIVEYDRHLKKYRVSYFEHGHFVADCQFPACEKH